MSTYDYESHIIKFLIIRSQAFIFKDVIPLFKDLRASTQLSMTLQSTLLMQGTRVIGAEARGFLCCPGPVAYKLGAERLCSNS